MQPIPGLFIANAAVKRYSNNSSLFQNSGRRYLCTQTNAFGCVTCYKTHINHTHAQSNGKHYMFYSSQCASCRKHIP